MSSVTNSAEVNRWVEIIHFHLSAKITDTLLHDKNNPLDIQKTSDLAEQIFQDPIIKAELSEEISKTISNNRSINTINSNLVISNAANILSPIFSSTIPKLIEKIDHSPTKKFLTKVFQANKEAILAEIKSENTAEEGQRAAGSLLGKTKPKVFEEEKKVQPVIPKNNGPLSSRLINGMISNTTLALVNKYKEMFSKEVAEQAQAGFQFLWSHPKSKSALSEYTNLADAIPTDTLGYSLIVFKLFYEKMNELFSKTFPEISKTEEFTPYIGEITEGIFEAEFGFATELFKGQMLEYERLVSKLQP